MKLLLLQFFALLFISSISAQSISQQVLNTTGYTSTAKTMELTWSVGEMATATLNTSNMILTQGFLQPDVSTHNSGIEPVIISVDISVFPNPVHSMLYISQTKNVIETMSLYNDLGQRIMEQKFENPSFDMSLLKPGIYFINLINYGEKEFHTFKIIKY